MDHLSAMNADFPAYNNFRHRYLGIRLVDLTPARATPVNEPTVVVQYADGEVSWFQRIADKELWLFRSSDAGEQELSSILDRRKWKRRKISVEESSRRCVIDVCLRVTLCFLNTDAATQHLSNNDCIFFQAGPNKILLFAVWLSI
jgi:hypothetical protein